MHFGFIKLGLKTYFKKCGTGQGSNHELVDVFDILEKHGHWCSMVSGSDREQDEDWSKIDIMLVFNGPCGNGKNLSSIMLKNYTKPYLDIINKLKIPMIYFWTDPRKEYDPMKIDYLTHKPEIILSQEKEFYGHLDKLVLYRQELKELRQKSNFEIFMSCSYAKNPTRYKKINSIKGWFGDKVIISGVRDEEKKKIDNNIPEQDFISHLNDKVKFSYNLAAQPNWCSQKFWEMILGNVICFYERYDEDNLILDSNSYLRVKDEIELDNKIGELSNDYTKYKQLIDEQRYTIFEDYLNGEFFYQFLMSKLKNL
jgi:hypothetical protein